MIDNQTNLKKLRNMRKITLSILVLLLTMVSQGAWAQIYPIPLSGSGEPGDPYLISSNSNWNTFANYVSYESYTGKCYKLTADITVTTMAGLIDPSVTSEAMRAFKGTLDGDGHTITLNLNVTKHDDNTPAAPFAQLSGATVKNLNVTGSITTDGRRAASIASFVTENSTITNCTSSVNITSSRDADVDAGAFVGRVNANKTLTMSNCAFMGSITYSSSQGYEGGGLVGWLQANTTANLTNCVFAPTSVSFNKTENVQYKMFTNGESSSTTNLTNCFYNDVAAGNMDITAQGGTQILTTISNNSDWENFSMIVNYGYDYSGKTVTLANNVGTVTKVVGTKDKPFVGTFDGGGHTLTVNINVTGDNEFAPAAPFAAIGATIKNLSVTGSITTIGMRPASIASFVIGNSIITNCKSSVNITSSYGGSIEAGGFVGRVNENKSLTMSGCAFTGSIHFTNEYGSEGGGMVGYLMSYATATITNCLFAPTSVSFARDNYVGLFGTFVGNAVFGESTLVKCFYNSVANIEAITKEGKQMRSISAGGGVSSLAISGDATATYNVSGITDYETGIMYNSKYYAGKDDEVNLTLSHSAAPSGKYFDMYRVAGGGSLIEQEETTATLVMTDANQTIIAQYMMTSCVEGPWTLQGMKTHVCANDGSSTSVSFNNMNNGTWNGTITPWKDDDGVGYTFEDNNTACPSWSTMGIFSTYKYENTVNPYSSLKLTWTYQLRSKTTEHHSTTCLYARQGEYSDITDMEVDFTNYYKSQLGFMYLLDHFTNSKNNGKIEKADEKTKVIEFDNLDGNASKPAVCYLLLTHVFASGDDQRDDMKEWGSFKNVSYSVSTTYRMIVSFDANDGSGSMSVQNIDGSKKLSPNCFYRDGYTFDGWATSPNGEKVYNDGAEITVTSENKGPVTLYAVWTEGGGSSASREVGPWKLMEWRTMLCDAAANTTMAFNRMNNWCWGTLTALNDQNCIGFAVTGNSPDNKKNAVFSLYGMTQSVPAYAKCRTTWGYQIGSRNKCHYSRVQLFANPDLESLKSMEVDFVVNGSSGNYPDHRLAYLYNNSFANQPAYSPANGSYDIEFDNLDGNSTADMSTYLMLTHVSSSVSGQSDLNEQGLLKHLSRADNWTYRKIVSFDANGGAGTMVDQMIDNSGTLTANTFTREGYTFAGWATAPNGAVVYTDGQEVTATSEDKGPVTLYAVWTPIAYTLVYELNGGAATNPATYATTETLTLNAPTKEDYTFIGWTGANGTVPQTSVTIIKGSTGEKTFTAHWMSNAVSATVAQINAIGEVNYPTSGTAITAARTSYDALSEADQALVANYGTLTAAEQTYEAARDAAGSKTIRFVNKDNAPITEQSVGMNLEAPVIPGFTFDHWQVVEKNISADQTIRLQAVYTSNMNNAPKVYTNPANLAQKLVRQGDVYILQDKEN